MNRPLGLPLLALVVAAVVPLACAGTGGDLVEIELAFSGGAPQGVTLGRGETLYDPAWQVELEEARLVLGAAYVFPPPRSASSWSLLGATLGASVAHAHAGDENLFGVNALAEYREQVVVDALNPEPLVVGPLLAEAGRGDAVSVWIDAPRNELAGPDGPTHGFHGWVRGVARQGQREIRFEGGITLEDTPLSQRVDRIALGDAMVGQGSRVVLEVHAGRWLEQVDFAALIDDGRLVVEEDGVARPVAPHAFQQAWLISFHDPEAFAASVE